MNRRKFTFSLAAFGLAPLLPVGKMAGAIASPASAGAAMSSSYAAKYKWAEVLVRSHKNCSASFLQRHLKIGAAQAANIELELIRNGVISASQNAYGFRQATKPLWDEVLPKLQSNLQKAARKLNEGSKARVKQSVENALDSDENSSMSAEMTDSRIPDSENRDSRDAKHLASPQISSTPIS